MFLLNHTKIRMILILMLGPVLSAPAFADGMIKSPPLVNVKLLRQQDKTGEAILHITAPLAYTGCAKISNLEHSVDVTERFINIYVTNYTIDFPDAPIAPGKPCPQKFQVPAANIPLDRALIEGNKIKTININLSGGLAPQVYDLDLGADTLTLTPRRPSAKTPAALRPAMDPMVFTYYPEHTLLLSAPVAPQNDRASILADFAQTNGFKPLTAVINGFNKTSGHSDSQYYIDQSNHFGDIVSSNENVVIGHSGAIDIYARKPGAAE